MTQYCDLHTHSIFSDGTLTPEELVDLAVELGLGAVALTDHNTVLGLPRFLAAAEGKPLEAVPGVEFSVDYQDRELHILALYISAEHYGEALAIADEMQENKRKSNIALVESLNKAGYHISYEKIKASMPAGEPNRALIAKELAAQGYVTSNQEAFEKLLSPKHGYYVPPKRIDALELIAFIRKIGAVAIWAHPFLHLKQEEEVRRFLEKAIPVGLQGMETLYPKYTPEQTALAQALAKEYHLLESGGSDFHGENKPDVQLGTGKGELKVPMEMARKIKGKI